MDPLQDILDFSAKSKESGDGLVSVSSIILRALVPFILEKEYEEGIENSYRFVPLMVEADRKEFFRIMEEEDQEYIRQMRRFGSELDENGPFYSVHMGQLREYKTDMCKHCKHKFVLGEALYQLPCKHVMCETHQTEICTCSKVKEETKKSGPNSEQGMGAKDGQEEGTKTSNDTEKEARSDQQNTNADGGVQSSDNKRQEGLKTSNIAVVDPNDVADKIDFGRNLCSAIQLVEVEMKTGGTMWFEMKKYHDLKEKEEEGKQHETSNPDVVDKERMNSRNRDVGGVS